jgi:hypothetical protein
LLIAGDSNPLLFVQSVPNVLSVQLPASSLIAISII